VDSFLEPIRNEPQFKAIAQSLAPKSRLQEDIPKRAGKLPEQAQSVAPPVDI
jgi:hypothetical protein